MPAKIKRFSSKEIFPTSDRSSGNLLLVGLKSVLVFGLISFLGLGFLAFKNTDLEVGSFSASENERQANITPIENSIILRDLSWSESQPDFFANSIGVLELELVVTDPLLLGEGFELYLEDPEGQMVWSQIHQLDKLSRFTVPISNQDFTDLELSIKNPSKDYKQVIKIPRKARID